MPKFLVVGLAPGETFYWNGRPYRQFDRLEADLETTDPEALRHLLHYPDSLVARGVVEPVAEPSQDKE